MQRIRDARAVVVDIGYTIQISIYRIAVNDGWIGSSEEFRQVANTIAIGVGCGIVEQRIQAIQQLKFVRHPIAIIIWITGITGPVCIGIELTGVMDIQTVILVIGHSITIAIRKINIILNTRVGAVEGFLQVADAIEIGITARIGSIQGIQAIQVFVGITHAIIIVIQITGIALSIRVKICL